MFGLVACVGLSWLARALKLRVPANRITEIVKCWRGVRPETALRLGRHFKTGPDLWSRLQVSDDIAVAEREFGATVRGEVEEAG